MVMKQLGLTVVSIAGKTALTSFMEKAFRPKTPDEVQAALEAAAELADIRRVNAIVAVTERAQPAPSLAQEAGQPCPACQQFDELVLAHGYCSNIVRACSSLDPGASLPAGYGGTVVQVREHLATAVQAAQRIGAERPAMKPAADLMAHGVGAIGAMFMGDAVTCGTVREALPMLEEAESAADKVAQAWFRKPADGSAQAAPNG